MSFGNTTPTKFGKNFGLFLKYWNYCSERGGQYTSLEVNILKSFIYDKLKELWLTNQWNVDELNWICYALDHNHSRLDPTNLLNNQFAYLYHAKNSYHLKE